MDDDLLTLFDKCDKVLPAS